jgi:hypothetical protein
MVTLYSIKDKVEILWKTLGIIKKKMNRSWNGL